MSNSTASSGASAEPARVSDADAERSLVILPTYNEAENIEEIVRVIRSHGPYSILVIDDGSPDGTGAIAERLATDLANLRVIHREGKLGLGTAYRLGFDETIGGGFHRAVEMDSDFQHDPADIPRIVARALADDAPALVIGSRYVPGGRIPQWKLSRRLLSRGGNRFAQFWLGWRVKDYTGGYRCYRREALEAIDRTQVRSNGYSFQIEMTAAVQFTGGRIAEVPIAFHDRRAGQSKMHWSIPAEALLTVVRLGLRRWCGLGRRRYARARS